ncbi:MAG: hypothetical protein QW650_01075 [Thermofilum sp.]
MESVRGRVVAVSRKEITVVPSGGGEPQTFRLSKFMDEKVLSEVIPGMEVELELTKTGKGDVLVKRLARADGGAATVVRPLEVPAPSGVELLLEQVQGELRKMRQLLEELVKLVLGKELSSLEVAEAASRQATMIVNAVLSSTDAVQRFKSKDFEGFLFEVTGFVQRMHGILTEQIYQEIVQLSRKLEGLRQEGGPRP